MPSVFILSIVVIAFNRLEPFSEDNRSDLKKTLKLDYYSTGENADIISEVYLITEGIGPFKHQFELKKILLSVVIEYDPGIYNSWEVLKKNEKPMKFDL